MEGPYSIFDWLSDTDNLTAIAVVVIAIFTIALTLATRRQAMLTRESIRVVERALLDLERATIFPVFNEPVERGARDWYVHVTLTNVGRSPGTIKGVYAKSAPPDALPVKPPKKGFEERGTDTVLRAGESWNGLAPFRLPATQDGQIFYGYVRYEDVFGRAWRRRFAVAVWSEESPDRQFFQPIGGDIYNGDSLED
jgi:hypothetical protein